MTGKHSEFYEYSQDPTEVGNPSYVDLHDYPHSLIDPNTSTQEPVMSRNYPILFNNDTFDPNQVEGYSVNTFGEKFSGIAVGELPEYKFTSKNSGETSKDYIFKQEQCQTVSFRNRRRTKELIR